MSSALDVLGKAIEAHRREQVQATAELLDGLMATDRQVRDVRLRGGDGGAVLVGVGNVTVRLAMPSVLQAMALHELHRRGPVTLALAMALDDGRALLGFSGVDEDVLVSTRVKQAPTGRSAAITSSSRPATPHHTPRRAPQGPGKATCSAPHPDSVEGPCSGASPSPPASSAWLQ